jgi:hypothetical protein
MNTGSRLANGAMRAPQERPDGLGDGRPLDLAMAGFPNSSTPGTIAAEDTHARARALRGRKMRASGSGCRRYFSPMTSLQPDDLGLLQAGSQLPVFG